MVAYESVYDPSAPPPEDCDEMVDLTIDLFTGVGLQDVGPTRPPTVARRSPATRPARRARRRYSSTSTTTSSRRSATTAWVTPPWTLTERDGRWYGRGAADCKGEHRHPPHRPARPRRRAARQREDHRRRVGGARRWRARRLRAAAPRSARADAIIVCDAGNFAVGVPSLTTTLRGVVEVVVTVRTLSSAMHSGVFGGAAPDALAALDRDAGDVA